MQGESVRGKLATWIAGVLGVWAGMAAFGSIIAALMFPQWALLREPIVLAESPSLSTDGNEANIRDVGVGGLQPIVTTVTFRLGLWTACPYINTSTLQMMMIGSPPCSDVSYSWEHITHQDLQLPAPAPLVQTVVARMRLSAPFLLLSCGLLAIGTLLAVIGRCCYAHASIVAALMFSLGGLSVGVGVVWFVSVISEEYGIASGRRTTWADMYAYRYGWSLMAAGGGGVAALLAALLTGHSHLSRHAPLATVLRGKSSGTEESLSRPLLTCRGSEGCLGQRSFTSDTIRTYLTCDSRRHPPRGCLTLPLPHSHSIVDLTRQPDELCRFHRELSRSQEDPSPDVAISRRSSKGNVIGDDPKEFNNLYKQQQQQYILQKQQQMLQQQQQQQQPQNDAQNIHQPTQHSREWPVETSKAIIEDSREVEVTEGVPPPPTTQILSPVTPVPPPPPLSSSSSSSSHYELPSDPPPPKPASASSRRSVDSGRGFLQSACEPMALPEYNTFTVGDYSRTLPTKGRQMAVFDRRSSYRSSTLSRSFSKISSEV